MDHDEIVAHPRVRLPVLGGLHRAIGPYPIGQLLIVPDRGTRRRRYKELSPHRPPTVHVGLLPNRPTQPRFVKGDASEKDSFAGIVPSFRDEIRHLPWFQSHHPQCGAERVNFLLLFPALPSHLKSPITIHAPTKTQRTLN